MIRKILPALCLIALSHTASAGVIVDAYDTGVAYNRNNDGTISATNPTVPTAIFNWSAECSDCNSFKGDTSFSNSNFVTGNITLDKGVVDGNALDGRYTFDQSDLVSFQYNGPSDHIDNLIIHNANYEKTVGWFDESDMMSNIFGGDIFFGDLTLNPLAVDVNGYTNFSENMYANGWISADFTNYFLDLTFDTFVPIDIETGEYIKGSALDGGVTLFEKQTFNILYESNGSWEINVNGIAADLGRGAGIVSSATEVPEPSTLAIMGLGLLGLVRFRSKKS